MSMTMSKLRDNRETDGPRWGVRLERSHSSNFHRNPHHRSGRKRDRIRPLRIFVMTTFLMHGMVYAILMAMLFVINLLTWSGQLWVLFPIVGWGAFLAMHGAFAWFTSNVGISSGMVERAREPISPPAVIKSKQRANTPAGELDGIVVDSLVKVDEMRAIGRQMRTPSARRNALFAVSSIENTILALEGKTDELPLAREFSGSFLEPAHRIFVEYDRLSTRDIQSAKNILDQVEKEDLPRITERAEQVYERVHRGTMIDLQVAREMLNLADGA